MSARLLRWCSALALVLALGGTRALGSGSFVSEHPLPALDQPRGGRAIFEVVPGTAYGLVKRGGPEGGWCKLLPPDGGTPGWVRCEDGVEGHDAWEGRRASTAGRCATSCGNRALLPSPPALSEVDREVLSVCPARPEAAVSREDARRFFAEHLEDPRLQRALSMAGRPGDREAAAGWLTDLWIGTGPRNAFTHVFCGDDWTRPSIGGLHWLPRYAQLEAQGRICYAGPVRRGGPERNGAYRIRFKGLSPWSCARKRDGGFTAEHDPLAMVALGTRAFVRCCARGGGRKEGGVYAAADLGGSAYRIWCGSRNGTYGIASFYPTEERVTCRD